MGEHTPEKDAKVCASDIFVSSANIAGEWDEPVMRVVAACNRNGVPDCGWEVVVTERWGDPMDPDDWGITGKEWAALEAAHRAHTILPREDGADR